jgi:hypothetical protein
MARLSTTSHLDELAVLSRDLLHVFVAGPGYGEGIAIPLVRCPAPEMNVTPRVR